MVQLIKKGGLRERANRSRTYQGSENTETTLKPNRYQNTTSCSLLSEKNETPLVPPSDPNATATDASDE